MSVEEQNQIEEGNDELYEHHRIIADKGQELLRIDKFLLNRLEKVSRNKIQNAARAGAIRVNDKPVKPNYRVRPNDTITVVLSSPAREHKLEGEDIPLDIVFEDNHLVVINKQVGLVVHPGSGNHTGTLVNALLHHFENLPHSGDVTRPGLVHRLDKNTSGLMVIAKDEYCMTHLAKQFFDRTISRRYQALAWGTFDEEEGTIEGHIGRNQRYRKKMDVYPEGEFGKVAITHYKVLERLGYVTLVECKLDTGRTHQIRVHMMYQNHPLFNDEVYGGDKIVKGTVYTKYRQFVENCFKVMPRQALHAYILGFIHPITGKELHFEADLPEDFSNVLHKWRGYYEHALK